MLQNLLYVGAAFLLVLLNGFFVAAEFALVKLRQTQAASLGERHGWRGRILVNVHGKLDAYLSACQLGITLSSLGLGWIGEPAFARLLDPVFVALGLGPETGHLIAFIVAFTIISFLHIVLGELAPKTMAIRRPESMSLWTAAPLYAFYWMMYPAIYVLNASANGLLRVAGLDGIDEHSHSFSRDELKLILHGKRAGRDSGEEIAMMSHALELPELVVGDLLRTRDQLAYLHDGMSLDEVVAEFRRSQYSRYPWFDEDEEHVRGVLHAKDVLHLVAAGKSGEDLPSLLRPAIVEPLDTPVLDVLKRFKKGQTHMALGQEESGRIVGFFTMEDVVEVIVGDIQDELRRNTPSSPQRANDGSFTLSGGTPIYRLERLLERDIEAPDDVNSIGGLIIHRLERLPSEGERLVFEGFDLTVMTMKGARAQVIAVHPHRPS